ncbi:ATP-binding cassette domain-containing protein [Aliarcobacter cibarius]|jgi:iron complex transport system ATP-binding protein|uniref:ABC transporter ATP-binding protein n=1 Tax=Aliarcobacter cibarius TaxID=255507 RepID=A0A5J6RHJ9_9BACT|nr:ABC transporter ATP-binding protein [Aliarcobacter cibarius]MBP9491429.1 ABC transporter ATP-binding protein [Aliarcobacter sp.]QEZ89372.1 iron siderophore ABC transporter, ATP-binding protein [Aliarcobacter cibarius]QKJ27371.1 iron siderophore ABC transporter, ATP-binding protein [Aliarcobacter cibarius]TLS97053.1 ABC transporter ATP-binding protein [Aliarcobacter cibarius]TLS97563.1 ABC transporter ATP-binding protein [Aliarcobacter cibarius]
MLELKNYNNFILKDISFVLEEKENLLILGENGAGKSTLAKVLSNLIDSSNLFFRKQNIKELDSFKRAKLINYIPSRFEVFDDYLTVFEFLKLSCIEEKNNKEIKSIISLLKFEDLKDSYCSNLSSGEQQLLQLASAILHDAQITIFDELTANLDLNRLKEVFGILNSNFLKQKIIITHNLDFAYALKDFKVLFLEKGNLKFFDSHDKFFTQENLNKYYNESVKLINSHLVLDL